MTIDLWKEAERLFPYSRRLSSPSVERLRADYVASREPVPVPVAKELDLRCACGHMESEHEGQTRPPRQEWVECRVCTCEMFSVWHVWHVPAPPEAVAGEDNRFVNALVRCEMCNWQLMDDIDNAILLLTDHRDEAHVKQGRVIECWDCGKDDGTHVEDCSVILVPPEAVAGERQICKECGLVSEEHFASISDWAYDPHPFEAVVGEPEQWVVECRDCSFSKARDSSRWASKTRREHETQRPEHNVWIITPEYQTEVVAGEDATAALKADITGLEDELMAQVNRRITETARAEEAEAEVSRLEAALTELRDRAIRARPYIGIDWVVDIAERALAPVSGGPE